MKRRLSRFSGLKQKDFSGLYRIDLLSDKNQYEVDFLILKDISDNGRKICQNKN